MGESGSKMTVSSMATRVGITRAASFDLEIEAQVASP